MAVEYHQLQSRRHTKFQYPHLGFLQYRNFPTVIPSGSPQIDTCSIRSIFVGRGSSPAISSAIIASNVVR